MLLGHYAAGLAAKKFAPKTNLGLLVLAAVFLDLIWPLFLSLQWESVVIAPGTTEVTPLFFVHYPWSHSLLMSAAWGLGLGGLYFALTRYGTGAIVLGLLVVSHWFLDAPMHQPDLPLVPWSETMVGFALWNSVPLSFLIEYGLLAGGVYLYATSTHARTRMGRWGLIAFAVLGAFVYVANFLGPPPPGITALILGACAVQALFILLALWTDRGRSFIPEATPERS
jgi:hypothetical protein